MTTMPKPTPKYSPERLADLNEQHRDWLRNGDHNLTQDQQLALTWNRHLFMHEDSHEGANLIEQSVPHLDLSEICAETFGGP